MPRRVHHHPSQNNDGYHHHPTQFHPRRNCPVIYRPSIFCPIYANPRSRVISDRDDYRINYRFTFSLIGFLIASAIIACLAIFVMMSIAAKILLSLLVVGLLLSIPAMLISGCTNDHQSQAPSPMS